MNTQEEILRDLLSSSTEDKSSTQPGGQQHDPDSSQVGQRIRVSHPRFAGGAGVAFNSFREAALCILLMDGVPLTEFLIWAAIEKVRIRQDPTRVPRNEFWRFHLLHDHSVPPPELAMHWAKQQQLVARSAQTSEIPSPPAVRPIPSGSAPPLTLRYEPEPSPPVETETTLPRPPAKRLRPAVSRLSGASTLSSPSEEGDDEQEEDAGPLFPVNKRRERLRLKEETSPHRLDHTPDPSSGRTRI